MVDKFVRAVSRYGVAFSLGMMGTSIAADSQQVADRDAASVARAARESQRVTLSVDNALLVTVLHDIAQQAGWVPVYDATLLPPRARVTLHLRNVPALDAFQQALRGTGLSAQLYARGQVGIVAEPVAMAGTIVGKVTNAKTKQPIVNATVLLNDATHGIQTGDDGTYRLSAAAGTHRVTVRAVGFVKSQTAVVVTDQQVTTADVALSPSASVLDEVIVTGTVVATERKAIPNPITVITAEQIEQRGATRIDQLLRGEVPGVIAIDNGADVYTPSLVAATESRVFSRGVSSIDGAASPLKTYIDGVEILDPTYLGTIDPRSIERIEIIAGPQAATVYGSGAMGGVMQIFTKKGTGRSTPDVTLTLRYGALETSVSPRLTPTHNDVVNVAGGSGPEFSYAMTGSYLYTGQWQPALFSRMAGASLGATHTRGPLTASGSVSLTSGASGTTNLSVLDYARRTNGDWVNTGPFGPSPKRSKSSSQTGSLNVDYRMTPRWQHHATVGRSQTAFDLVPTAPSFRSPSDTLYSLESTSGYRTTMGYNMTLLPLGVGGMTTLTVGMTSARATQTVYNGSKASGIATMLTDAYVFPYRDDKSWGGFGQAQVGLFGKLFLTLGIRGERNPTYGSAHGIDWTPTQGLTYAVDIGDVTVKLLTSYGKATRAPNAGQREQKLGNDPRYAPAQYVSQLANPDLTPEYSSGPQGGIEVYYGNRGSLTINHYRQSVTDLLVLINQVDSVPRTELSSGNAGYWYQGQYINAAKVRQQGWEATASMNIAALTMKGTYSWTDSRVLAGNPQFPTLYPKGKSFPNVPSHVGNVVVGYAHGGTSLTLVTNVMGAVTTYMYTTANGLLLFYEASSSRALMYVPRKRTISTGTLTARRGYAKSDLSASQRIAPWASLIVNVTNLGNSYGSEAQNLSPAVGRTSAVGMSLRFP